MKVEVKLPDVPRRTLDMHVVSGNTWYSAVSADGYQVAVYVTPLPTKS